MSSENAATAARSATDCYVVDLDRLRDALAVIAEVNATPLDKVQFVKSGAEVQISDKQREEWRFIGLTNAALAEMMILS